MKGAAEPVYPFIDLFPEAILLVDTQGVIVAVNQAARHHLAACTIFPGQTSLLAMCAESEHQVRRYLHACASTKSFMPGTVTIAGTDATAAVFHSEGALYVPRKDAALPILLLRLTPKSESASRFIILNRQIEELSHEVERRRRAEAELIEQRELLRVMLTGIGDAVITTDVHAAITFLNPVAEIQTGWSGADAIGKPLAEVFRIVNERNRETVESPIDKVLRDGVIVDLANHALLIRKDGTEVPIDNSGAPIRGAGGSIIGAVLIFHDITERRRLEQQVDVRTLELEAEHRRKDEFLAMLGHELRNPLAPIKAALQLQALPQLSEEANRHAREIMDRQVDHLTRLVDELLDVARINTGKITLKEELLEVASVIYRAAELCDPVMRDKEQQFSIQMTPEPLYLHGDLQRLTQVVGNLLNNAAKYTQRGGTIKLTVLKNGDHVEITVKDNGMGIHPVTLPRIFEVFSQAERALARSEGGLGVGLTLARRLVEKHGGSIAAHSEGLEQGSEFRISLPLVQAPDAPGLYPLQALPAMATRKILVVDDNPDAAAMLAELLRLLGNEVIIAPNGEQAIAAATRFLPKVIFMDIGLPGMDGYAIAKALRAQSQTAGIVLVAVTGYGQQDDIRKTQNAGFDHHLVKPADLSRINGILASLSDS